MIGASGQDRHADFASSYQPGVRPRAEWADAASARPRLLGIRLMALRAGRPRAYDAEAALSAAAAVFAQRGYAAASLDRLEAATGMRRPSLYAAFGDKLALYHRALAHDLGWRTAEWRRAMTQDTDLPTMLLAALTCLLDLSGDRPSLALAAVAGLDGAVPASSIQVGVEGAFKAWRELLAARLERASPPVPERLAEPLMDQLLGLAARLAISGRTPAPTDVTVLAAMARPDR
jgi:AcrR family transcriptional regulator